MVKNQKDMNIVNKQTLNDLRFIHNNYYGKNFLKNKKILITGAGGFVGYYLSLYLIKYKKELKINKILLTDIKIKNILPKINFFKNTTNFAIKKFDVIKDDINKLIPNDINVIIHAASVASPTKYRKEPLQTADANVIGLRKILEFAKKNEKVKILYFSSSEIYGDPDIKNIPTKEAYNGNVSTTGPRACYDEAKRYCETLAYIFNKKFKTKISIVRPFNNFGPGMNISDLRLPSDMAKSILNKKKIFLFSNGSPKRSFCYIADAVVGYLEALSYKTFEIFNIGNTKEMSVLQFAKLFSRASNKIYKYTPKIIFKKNKDKDYLINNPNRRSPDISKARKLLKYHPKINTYNGIVNYLKFLKENNR